MKEYKNILKLKTHNFIKSLEVFAQIETKINVGSAKYSYYWEFLYFWIDLAKKFSKIVTEETKII